MSAMFNSPTKDSMAINPLAITPRRDTAAWRLQVWISFGVVASLCAIGLAWLPGTDLDRAFIVMGYVYCMSSAFALAKFVRTTNPLASTRLCGNDCAFSDRIQTVTVDSVFAWLQRSGLGTPTTTVR
jgi:hypothetical protein